VATGNYLEANFSKSSKQKWMPISQNYLPYFLLLLFYIIKISKKFFIIVTSKELSLQKLYVLDVESKSIVTEF